MLSTRGQKYEALDLAAGYTKVRGDLYHKTKYPSGLVSLTNAENFLMQEETLTFIKEKCSTMDTSVLTYHEGPFGSKRLRQATANFINKMFSPCTSMAAEQISYTSGVTALNEILAMCLTDPNEGILLGMPIYGSFNPDFQTVSGCKLVYVPFKAVDQFSVQAIAAYEQAFYEAECAGTKIRALLLANPHNPLGRCYSDETLKAFMQFCGKHDIHIISDEIYALSVYHTDQAHPGFTSILSIDPSDIIDRKLIHVLYGMAKDFAAAGLRLGCLITSNANLTQAVQSLARFHWASPISDALAASILEDIDFVTSFTERSRTKLREHQKLALNTLNHAGIPSSPNPNAGFFLWINLQNCLRGRDWDAETDLQKRLHDAGLEISSGRAYHDEHPGWFRLIFSIDRDILEEALRRLVSFYETNVAV